MVKFVSQINARAEEVYNWHQSFGADERLTPPWVSKQFLRQEHNDNQTLKFMKTFSGVQLEKVTSDQQNKSIVSEKIQSSQQKTLHYKSFNNLNNKTLIKETISVNFFNSILPESIINSILSKKLEREFNFRGQRIEKDLSQHKRFASYNRQNIAFLGADNDIARQFKPFFTSGGHSVFSFVKRKPYPTAREIQLNTTNRMVGLEKLQDINSVVFFPIDNKTKITDANFDKILKEKVSQLRLMISSFIVNKKFPETFIMMSDTCVYKDSNANNSENSQVDEKASKMAFFYLTLEKELKNLEYNGVRVIYARAGNILTMKSGVLKNTLQQNKFTLSRTHANSSKYLNWVNLDDAIYATNQMLFDKRFYGPVNLCSSMTLGANDLALLIAQKTRLPILFSVPSFISKLFYGNINAERIYQNNSIYPQKLRECGFNFQFDNIDDTLNWETGSFNNKQELGFY